ncbi:EAL domain-containing protein [Actinoplanes sp. KI2]|uniref:putative bifunctional diguanylate cyclase/phosphodiesterase n=1 Tax=Actinoplanes sp. KI2 TaxID=2983315 RepID=UPI0021D5ABFE|nr:EAL domain-containing protein [Actinoplanes sp. KI2]MCU7723590.1 EAL domain-containing protein [Actinoplanes sp. KI2]
MAVQPPVHSRPTDRVTFVAVPAAAVIVLLAGAAGLTPPAVALAIGVGGAGLWACSHLVRAALQIHHAEGTFVACKGAGFVGLASLATALTAVVPLAAPPRAGVWATGGYAVAAALYAVGVLFLPGGATTWVIRTRRAFDGAGLGLSLAFAGYLIPPVKHQQVATLPVIMLGALAIAITVVAVLRSRPHGGPAVRCGAGAIAVMAALGIIATMVVLGRGGIALPLLGLPIVAGLAASADGGARRHLAPPPLEPRNPDQVLASYPLLAAPAAVGVFAALWHLLTARTFDTLAILLGVGMVAVLAVRELLVVRDIRRYAGQLQTAEAHFRSLVAGATDLTLVLDQQQRITWQSPAASRLFGLTDDEVVGRAFRDLIHPGDVADAQAVIDSVVAGEHADGPPALVNARLRDGAELWRDTESTISDQRAVPEVAALVVHVRDVGERKHLERALHKLSSTDQLTGLANRRTLMRDLLAHRRRPGRPGSLLVIDLHGLAEINDSRGRETGDAVLTEVGRRIKMLLGADDVPARLGGDEFAVLTTDGAVLAYALATRIAAVLAEPLELPGSLVELHTSIGLAELAGGSSSDEVLRHADLARKRARQLGLDRVEWYDPDVEMKLNRRMELEQQLLGAAARGELDLVFQPVADLRDNLPVGVEALLRWRHPELGTILPGELLPIARAVGIAAELDEWVLDAACKHLTAWSTGDTSFWLSVNVSPRELLTARFPDQVAATLNRYHLPPERLVVEVAEDWIAEDVPAIVASLAGLRKLGVRAALDDFGAGQASLSHLRRLPVDMLKLDASLVNTSSEAAPGAGPAVLDVVVSLGRRLGLEIVAKGLETPEQIVRAAKAGCLYGQGFELGRPAPAERIEAYLESHRT